MNGHDEWRRTNDEKIRCEQHRVCSMHTQTKRTNRKAERREQVTTDIRECSDCGCETDDDEERETWD